MNVVRHNDHFPAPHSGTTIDLSIVLQLSSKHRTFHPPNLKLPSSGVPTHYIIGQLDEPCDPSLSVEPGVPKIGTTYTNNM